MKTTTKTFDAVAESRKWKEIIAAETNGVKDLCQDFMVEEHGTRSVSLGSDFFFDRTAPCDGGQNAVTGTPGTLEDKL